MLYGFSPYAITPYSIDGPNLSTLPPFTALLEDPDLRRIFLLELRPWDPVAAAIVEKRFGAGQVFGPRHYQARVLEYLSVESEIFGGINYEARALPTFGSIRIAIADEDNEALMALRWDGREVEVLMGGEGFSRGQFQRIFFGRTEEPTWDESVLDLSVQAPSSDLEEPINENKYAGDEETYGTEGDENLKDRMKPLCFGAPRNVSPVLVNRGFLVYQWHDGSAEGLDAVYDRAVVVDPVGDPSGGAKDGGEPAGDIARLGFPTVFAWTPAQGPIGADAATDDFTSDQRGLNEYPGYNPAGSAGRGTATSGGTDTLSDTTDTDSGTATAGGASTLTDSGKSWTVDQFVDRKVQITGGTGSGQVRTITANTATQLTVDTNWGTNPDATSTYEIGWADDELVGMELHLLGGTGSGQNETVTSNTFNQITVDTAWATQPDATTTYEVHDPATSGPDFSVYAAGMDFITAGFAAGGNNGTFTVDSVDTTGDVHRIGITGSLTDEDPETGQTLSSDPALTAGAHLMDRANGLMRLGATPDGIVTLDAKGDNGDGWVRTVADITKRIVKWKGGFADANLNLTSFSALNTAQSAPHSLYIDTEVQIPEVLDDLHRGILGYWTFDRLGLMTVGRMEFGSSQDTFEGRDIVTRPQRLPTGTPFWKRSIGYARCWAVMDENDVAGAATDDRKAFVKEEFRRATAEDATIKTRRAKARERTVDALFDQEADAQAEATRQLTLLGADRDRWSVTVDRQQFARRPGETVTLKDRRFGLDAGKAMLVFRVAERPTEKLTTFELWG